jgi:hypothetical protein
MAARIEDLMPGVPFSTLRALAELPRLKALKATRKFRSLGM